MTILEDWGGAAPTAPAPEVATSLNTVISHYSGQLAFASRHLIRHLRLSPVLAPAVAALAGQEGGA